ncbi:MAG: radical SAM protein [Phycisphaerales bacterium]|nr:MAG: radical SAM protein [Phycisphaerales bacterium]
MYPVIARRSRGLSVGINLNPDTTCNFNCVYCQVDRGQPRREGDVNPDALAEELDRMLSWVVDRSIFTHPHFAHVPDELKRVNDIAFSGDGEPTACAVFPQSVRIAARLKAKWSLHDVKLVLITNGSYLPEPSVAAALDVLMENNGEIWAKIDAGTEEHFRAVNRAKVSLQDVLDSITSTARKYPVVIQSLWMRLHDERPAEAQVHAFADRLRDIVRAGGRIASVQVYTIARKPTEPHVTPLTGADLEWVASVVRDRAKLEAVTY